MPARPTTSRWSGWRCSCCRPWPSSCMQACRGSEACCAKAKGAELRAVVHCVDRGNVYLCAAKGQDPKDRDWPAYMKGKTIAVGPYGGTPNSIMRYLLGKWKLDPKRDVTLIEVPNSAVPAAVRGGQAGICDTPQAPGTAGNPAQHLTQPCLLPATLRRVLPSCTN